jgi:hypothetical protein
VDIIQMSVKKLGCEDVGWIYLALDNVQWQAFVRNVMSQLAEL